ncbi:MAG TPA: hypothetical protein VFD59_13445 [Nocardioidaceae bacterium]|nr:hypothetical protein [Nocardioidaceae bacterium]
MSELPSKPHGRTRHIRHTGHTATNLQVRALHAVLAGALDGLLAEQRSYLDEFWTHADVELDGDPDLQQAVRFAMFHVLQAGARAEGRAIPAKGLTGPG